MVPKPTPVDARTRSPLFRPGVLVGSRYRLVAPIGRGTMGEVWRADHVTLGTQVAVKLVDTTARDDGAETLARFELEARAAASLKSREVVQILDHGADGNVAFIAMELLSGEGLDRRLARRGKLPPREVAQLVSAIGRGLARAHAAGVVHRDLKPSNVFLVEESGVETVKLLDFGIAKVLGASREAHVQTQAGHVLGTPAYMSPEQVLGEPIDARSDVWQMGVLAYECLLGRRPFDAGTLGLLFVAICSGEAPTPSDYDLVPAGFDAWFARAIRRDPSARFGSAVEAADTLAALLGGEPATDPSGRTAKSAWSAPLAAPRPRGRTALIFAVGMLLPLGAVAMLLARGGDPPGDEAAASASVAAPASTPPAPVASLPSSIDEPSDSASARSVDAPRSARAPLARPSASLRPRARPHHPPEPADPIGL